MRHWLPTIISLSRVPLAFLLVITYRPETNRIAFALGIYVVAAFTDKLDGVLARHLNVASYAGYLVDGFADRCVSLACILTAVFYHHLPLWVALIAVGREFLLGTCRLLDPSWYPPSKNERRHSLIVFGTSRIWFSFLLVGAFLQTLGTAELRALSCIATGVYGIVVIASFGLLSTLLTRQVGECIRRVH